MTEKPKLEVVDNPQSPTPRDALDIEALFQDPALGDGLTDTNWHTIPVDKPKDFFESTRIPTTGAVPKSTPTRPKARSKRRITFWGPRCGDGCRKLDPAFSLLASTAMARRVFGRSCFRGTTKRTTRPGRAPDPRRAQQSANG